MKRIPFNQRGFLLITAVILIVTVALLATVITFLSTGNVLTSANHANSAKALFLAESGTEYEQRRLAQNVDWYRATTDPFDSATRNLGEGSFTVSVNLPATELSKRITGTGAVTANVFAGGTTNARWLATGTLMIDEDFTSQAEFATYNSTNATSFSITARNQSINGVLNSTAPAGTGLAHARGDRIYPVTTLGVALTNVCTTIPNPFTITDNSKFLGAGTITVFHNNAGTVVAEQISYSGYTISGATRTLLGVQRCQNSTTAITASVGDPVASMVANVGTVDFEVDIISLGTVNGAQRIARNTVQR